MRSQLLRSLTLSLPTQPVLRRRWTRLLLGTLVVAFMIPGARPYSSGAPESQCNSMVPLHGSSSNTYTSPFTVTVSSSTYSPMQLITVTIQRNRDDIYIRGFLLQARSADDRGSGTTWGYFSNGSGTKTACNSGAITHSYSTDRSTVTASWRAPSTPQGDLVFRATVVRTYSDFYTGVDSAVISPEIATTTTTTTTTPSTIAADTAPPSSSATMPPTTTTTMAIETTEDDQTSSSSGSDSTSTPVTTTLKEGGDTGGASLPSRSNILWFPLLVLVVTLLML